MSDLQSILTSAGDELADVLLIAIDFEGGEEAKHGFARHRNCEFGVATLDTRDLQAYLNLQTQGQATDLPRISTWNYTTGDVYRYRRALHSFRFGISEPISIYDIAEKIRKHVQILDLETGKPRHLILVGQGIIREMQVVRALQVSVKESLQSVLAYLNTQLMLEQVLQLPKGQSMSMPRLVQELEIPHEEHDFHTAGNDAEFTLRAMLLLAVRNHEEQNWQGIDERLMPLFQKIGLQDLPAKRIPSELALLEACLPTASLDDPSVPIDTTKFNVVLPTRQKRAIMGLRKKARKASNPNGKALL